VAAAIVTEESLFASASAAYPAAGLDDLGRPGRGFQTARAALERLLREHPDGDRAAAAELRLGLLQMDPANPDADLEAARASFERLVRRAPRAPEAPGALEAAALCRRLKGETAAAVALDVRLLAEHPADPAAARARLRLALEAGRRGDADASRLLPSDAESGASAPSRALGDLLRRAAEEEAGNAPRERDADASFDSPAVKQPVSMAASRVGSILVLDAASGRIVSAGDSAGDGAADGGSDGEPAVEAPDPPAEAPRRQGVALDPQGRVWTWDEKGVTPPDGARVEPRGIARKGETAPALKRIAAVAPGPLGTVDVVDASGEQVLRYGPGFVLRGVVPLPARPLAAARGDDGTLDVLLASRPRKVIEIHPGSPGAAGWPLKGGAEPGQGWETSTIPLEGAAGAGAPIAIARDALGRLYVLDEDARSVTLLDRAGRRVATFAAPKDSAMELRAPVSLAVDGAGRVYVGDKKLGRVVRYR